MHHRGRATAAALSGAVALAVAVGGCSLGAGDVELNGGIFDAMGVSSAANANRGGEPRLAPRAGIVLPPSERGLPPPGSSPETTASLQPEAWPDDPDQKRVRTAAQLDKAQAEFCRKQELQKSVDRNAALPDGPKGPCSGSILGIFGTSGNQQ